MNEDKKYLIISIILIILIVISAIVMFFRNNKDNNNTSNNTTTVSTKSEDELMIDAFNEYFSSLVKKGNISFFEISLDKELDKDKYCSSNEEKYGPSYDNQIQRKATLTYIPTEIGYQLTNNDKKQKNGKMEGTAIFILEKQKDNTLKIINIATYC